MERERECKALFPSEGKGQDDDDELGHLSGEDLFAVLNCIVQLLAGTIETLTSTVCSVHMIIECTNKHARIRVFH